jgi:Flp pilus assembly pilin Flp
MTTEYILLLCLFAFIVMGTFVGRNTGIEATFQKAGPRLGARVEKQLETGRGFNARWEAPGAVGTRGPQR